MAQPDIHSLIASLNNTTGTTGLGIFNSPAGGCLYKHNGSFVTEIAQGLTLPPHQDIHLNSGTKFLINIADTIHDFSDRPNNAEFLVPPSRPQLWTGGPALTTKNWAIEKLRKFLEDNNGVGTANIPQQLLASIPHQKKQTNYIEIATYIINIVARDPEKFVYYYLYHNDMNNNVGMASITDTVSFPNKNPGPANPNTERFYASNLLATGPLPNGYNAIAPPTQKTYTPRPVDYLFKPGENNVTNHIISGRKVQKANLSRESDTALAFLLRDLQTGAYLQSPIDHNSHAFVPYKHVYYSEDNGGRAVLSDTDSPGIGLASSYQCYTNCWKFDNGKHGTMDSPLFCVKDQTLIDLKIFAGIGIDNTQYSKNIILNNEAMIFYNRFEITDLGFTFNYNYINNNNNDNDNDIVPISKTLEHDAENKPLVKSLGQHLATVMTTQQGYSQGYRNALSICFKISVIDLIISLCGNCLQKIAPKKTRLDDFWVNDDNLLSAIFDLKRIGDYGQCKELNYINEYRQNCIPLVTGDKICACISHKIFGNYTILKKRYYNDRQAKEVLMFPFSTQINLINDIQTGQTTAGPHLSYTHDHTFREYTDYVHGNGTQRYPKTIPNGPHKNAINYLNGGKSPIIQETRNVKKTRKNSGRSERIKKSMLNINTERKQKYSFDRKINYDDFTNGLQCMHKKIEDISETNFDNIRTFKDKYWTNASTTPHQWDNKTYKDTSELLINIRYDSREQLRLFREDFLNILSLKNSPDTFVIYNIVKTYYDYLNVASGVSLKDLDKALLKYLEKFIIIMITNENFLEIFNEMFDDNLLNNDKSSILYYVKFITRIEFPDITRPYPPEPVVRNPNRKTYGGNLEKKSKKIENYESNINKINDKIILLKKNKIKNKDIITKQKELIKELKNKIKKEKDKEKIKLKKEKDKENNKLKKEKDKENNKLKKEKDKENNKLKKEKEKQKQKLNTHVKTNKKT